MPPVTFAAWRDPPCPGLCGGRQMWMEWGRCGCRWICKGINAPICTQRLTPAPICTQHLTFHPFWFIRSSAATLGSCTHLRPCLAHASISASASVLAPAPICTHAQLLHPVLGLRTHLGSCIHLHPFGLLHPQPGCWQLQIHPQQFGL